MARSTDTIANRVEALELEVILLLGRVERLEGLCAAGKDALADAYGMIAALQSQLAAKWKSSSRIPIRPIPVQ